MEGYRIPCCPGDYCIPKVKRSDAGVAGALTPVRPGSREELDILKTVRRSYLNEKFSSQYAVERISLVNNTKLETDFISKRQEMKEHGCDVTEKYLFSTSGSLKTFTKGKTAVQTQAKCALGDSTKGVYLKRNADICLRCQVAYHRENTHLLIYKAMLGRGLAVAPHSRSDPDPTHDCHVSREPPRLTDNYRDQYLKTQVYLYEYDDDGLPVQRPRQVLPYAAITLVDTTPTDEQGSPLTIHRKVEGFPMLQPVSTDRRKSVERAGPSVVPTSISSSASSDCVRKTQHKGLSRTVNFKPIPIHTADLASQEHFDSTEDRLHSTSVSQTVAKLKKRLQLSSVKDRTSNPKERKGHWTVKSAGGKIVLTKKWKEHKTTPTIKKVFRCLPVDVDANEDVTGACHDLEPAGQMEEGPVCTAAAANIMDRVKDPKLARRRKPRTLDYTDDSGNGEQQSQILGSPNASTTKKKIRKRSKNANRQNKGLLASEAGQNRSRSMVEIPETVENQSLASDESPSSRSSCVGERRASTSSESSGLPEDFLTLDTWIASGDENDDTDSTNTSLSSEASNAEIRSQPATHTDSQTKEIPPVDEGEIHIVTQTLISPKVQAFVPVQLYVPTIANDMVPASNEESEDDSDSVLEHGLQCIQDLEKSLDLVDIGILTSDKEDMCDRQEESSMEENALSDPSLNATEQHILAEGIDCCTAEVQIKKEKEDVEMEELVSVAKNFNSTHTGNVGHEDGSIIGQDTIKEERDFGTLGEEPYCGTNEKGLDGKYDSAVDQGIGHTLQVEQVCCDTSPPASPSADIDIFSLDAELPEQLVEELISMQENGETYMYEENGINYAMPIHVHKTEGSIGKQVCEDPEDADEGNKDKVVEPDFKEEDVKTEPATLPTVCESSGTESRQLSVASADEPKLAQNVDYSIEEPPSVSGDGVKIQVSVNSECVESSVDSKVLQLQKEQEQLQLKLQQLRYSRKRFEADNDATAASGECSNFQNSPGENCYFDNECKSGSSISSSDLSVAMILAGTGDFEPELDALYMTNIDCLKDREDESSLGAKRMPKDDQLCTTTPLEEQKISEPEDVPKSDGAGEQSDFCEPKDAGAADHSANIDHNLNMVAKMPSANEKGKPVYSENVRNESEDARKPKVAVSMNDMQATGNIRDAGDTQLICAAASTSLSTSQPVKQPDSAASGLKDKRGNNILTASQMPSNKILTLMGMKKLDREVSKKQWKEKRESFKAAAQDSQEQCSHGASASDSLEQRQWNNWKRQNKKKSKRWKDSKKLEKKLKHQARTARSFANRQMQCPQKVLCGKVNDGLRDSADKTEHGQKRKADTEVPSEQLGNRSKRPRHKMESAPSKRGRIASTKVKSSEERQKTGPLSNEDSSSSSLQNAQKNKNTNVATNTAVNSSGCEVQSNRSSVAASAQRTTSPKEESSRDPEVKTGSSAGLRAQKNKNTNVATNAAVRSSGCEDQSNRRSVAANAQRTTSPKAESSRDPEEVKTGSSSVLEQLYRDMKLKLKEVSTSVERARILLAMKALRESEEADVDDIALQESEEADVDDVALRESEEADVDDIESQKNCVAESSIEVVGLQQPLTEGRVVDTPNRHDNLMDVPEDPEKSEEADVDDTESQSNCGDESSTDVIGLQQPSTEEHVVDTPNCRDNCMDVEDPEESSTMEIVCDMSKPEGLLAESKESIQTATSEDLDSVAGHETATNMIMNPEEDDSFEVAINTSTEDCIQNSGLDDYSSVDMDLSEETHLDEINNKDQTEAFISPPLQDNYMLVDMDTSREDTNELDSSGHSPYIKDAPEHLTRNELDDSCDFQINETASFLIQPPEFIRESSTISSEPQSLTTADRKTPPIDETASFLREPPDFIRESLRTNDPQMSIKLKALLSPPTDSVSVLQSTTVDKDGHVMTMSLSSPGKQTSDVTSPSPAEPVACGSHASPVEKKLFYGRKLLRAKVLPSGRLAYVSPVQIPLQCMEENHKDPRRKINITQSFELDILHWNCNPSPAKRKRRKSAPQTALTSLSSPDMGFPTFSPPSIECAPLLVQAVGQQLIRSLQNSLRNHHPNALHQETSSPAASGPKPSCLDNSSRNVTVISNNVSRDPRIRKRRQSEPNHTEGKSTDKESIVEVRKQILKDLKDQVSKLQKRPRDTHVANSEGRGQDCCDIQQTVSSSTSTIATSASGTSISELQGDQSTTVQSEGSPLVDTDHHVSNESQTGEISDKPAKSEVCRSHKRSCSINDVHQGLCRIGIKLLENKKQQQQPGTEEKGTQVLSIKDGNSAKDKQKMCERKADGNSDLKKHSRRSVHSKVLHADVSLCENQKCLDRETTKSSDKSAVNTCSNKNTADQGISTRSTIADEVEGGHIDSKDKSKDVFNDIQKKKRKKESGESVHSKKRKHDHPQHCASGPMIPIHRSSGHQGRDVKSKSLGSKSELSCRSSKAVGSSDKSSSSVLKSVVVKKKAMKERKSTQHHSAHVKKSQSKHHIDQKCLKGTQIRKITDDKKSCGNKKAPKEDREGSGTLKTLARLQQQETQDSQAVSEAAHFTQDANNRLQEQSDTVTGSQSPAATSTCQETAVPCSEGPDESVECRAEPRGSVCPGTVEGKESPVHTTDVGKGCSEDSETLEMTRSDAGVGCSEECGNSQEVKMACRVEVTDSNTVHTIIEKKTSTHSAGHGVLEETKVSGVQRDELGSNLEERKEHEGTVIEEHDTLGQMMLTGCDETFPHEISQTQDDGALPEDNDKYMGHSEELDVTDVVAEQGGSKEFLSSASQPLDLPSTAECPSSHYQGDSMTGEEQTECLDHKAFIDYHQQRLQELVKQRPTAATSTCCSDSYMLKEWRDSIEQNILESKVSIHCIRCLHLSRKGHTSNLHYSPKQVKSIEKRILLLEQKIDASCSKPEMENMQRKLQNLYKLREALSICRSRERIFGRKFNKMSAQEIQNSLERLLSIQHSWKQNNINQPMMIHLENIVKKLQFALKLKAKKMEEASMLEEELEKNVMSPRPTDTLSPEGKDDPVFSGQGLPKAKITHPDQDCVGVISSRTAPEEKNSSMSSATSDSSKDSSDVVLGSTPCRDEEVYPPPLGDSVSSKSEEKPSCCSPVRPEPLDLEKGCTDSTFPQNEASTDCVMTPGTPLLDEPEQPEGPYSEEHDTLGQMMLTGGDETSPPEISQTQDDGALQEDNDKYMGHSEELDVTDVVTEQVGSKEFLSSASPSETASQPPNLPSTAEGPSSHYQGDSMTGEEQTECLDHKAFIDYHQQRLQELVKQRPTAATSTCCSDSYVLKEWRASIEQNILESKVSIHCIRCLHLSRKGRTSNLHYSPKQVKSIEKRILLLEQKINASCSKPEMETMQRKLQNLYKQREAQSISKSRDRIFGRKFNKMAAQEIQNSLDKLLSIQHSWKENNINQPMMIHLENIVKKAQFALKLKDLKTKKKELEKNVMSPRPTDTLSQEGKDDPMFSGQGLPKAKITHPDQDCVGVISSRTAPEEKNNSMSSATSDSSKDSSDVVLGSTPCRDEEVYPPLLGDSVSSQSEEIPSCCSPVRPEPLDLEKGCTDSTAPQHEASTDCVMTPGTPLLDEPEQPATWDGNFYAIILSSPDVNAEPQPTVIPIQKDDHSSDGNSPKPDGSNTDSEPSILPPPLEAAESETLEQEVRRILSSSETVQPEGQVDTDANPTGTTTVIESVPSTSGTKEDERNPDESTSPDRKENTGNVLTKKTPKGKSYKQKSSKYEDRRSKRQLIPVGRNRQCNQSHFNQTNAPYHQVNGLHNHGNRHTESWTSNNHMSPRPLFNNFDIARFRERQAMMANRQAHSAQRNMVNPMYQSRHGAPTMYGTAANRMDLRTRMGEYNRSQQWDVNQVNYRSDHPRYSITVEYSHRNMCNYQQF